jgi:hypothetical protein
MAPILRNRSGNGSSAAEFPFRVFEPDPARRTSIVELALKLLAVLGSLLVLQIHYIGG